jgi:hypothetical protein
MLNVTERKLKPIRWFIKNVTLSAEIVFFSQERSFSPARKISLDVRLRSFAEKPGKGHAREAFSSSAALPRRGKASVPAKSQPKRVFKEFDTTY